MAIIYVERDSTLKQSDIVMGLDFTDSEQVQEETKNDVATMQTAVFGIQTPLIAINDIVIQFSDVILFNLKSIDALPTVTMTVRDRYGLIAKLQTPSNDNELRVQILPPFDDAYKKVNLTFFISSIRVSGNYIMLTGSYKLPDLASSRLEALGELNTKELFDYISTRTGLGLASNCDGDDADKRWMYCDSKSYMELARAEISRSGTDGIVYDWWVDFWNNINIVNIYERYYAIDPKEDLEIWVNSIRVEDNPGTENKPIKVECILNNSPVTAATELLIKNYNIHNNSGGSISRGTDKVLSVWNENEGDYLDNLVQDGDIKKDIFVRYEYLGEQYGDYNYFLTQRAREAFLQKMNSETIEIELVTPMISLMRGHRVDVVWYDNDSNLLNKEDGVEELGGMEDTETYVPTSEAQPDDQEGVAWRIDKSISGQYLIIGTNIEFTERGWRTILTLTRPAAQRPQLMNLSEQ